MDKKLVVITFDALQNDDLDFLLSRPNFKKIADKLAVVKNLKEIYPTLTYPIHTTMVTGREPAESGIFHNQRADLYPYGNDFSIMGEDWYWQYDEIKCKTIFDHATEAGYKVGTSCWPVTAGAKNWLNVPEIWPLAENKEEIRQLFMESCSEDGFERFFDTYISNYGWKNNDDMVAYAPEIALDMLKEDKVDVLFCHAIILDHYRHGFGVYGEMTEEALRNLDIMTGRFVDAIEANGDWDKTNFVILGDHGQIDIQRLFHLNAAFVEKGLIDIDENGMPTNVKAFSFSAGFSTHIILTNPEDEAVKEEVYRVLCELKEQYPRCMERIYTAEEVAKEEGLAGELHFVVEGTLGTMFDMKYKGDVVVDRESPKYDKYLATHGYHPEKGVKPPLLAFGADIKAGAFVEHGEMLDVFPTCMELLGLEREGDIKGKVLDIIK